MILNNQSNKPITILDMGDVHVAQNNMCQITVVFPQDLGTHDYSVMLQMNNLKDANPQIFSTMVVIAKNSYGFQVELPGPVDSPNYILSWIVLGDEPKSAPPVLKFEPDYTDPGPPPKVCYHNWKKYTGLFEAYEYCEFCDEKKK